MTKGQSRAVPVRSLSAGVGLWIASAASTLAPAGCGLELPEVPEIDEDEFDMAKESLLELLRDLFPGLSDAELEALGATLSYDQVVALRDELEAARKVARELSGLLFQSAQEAVAERKEALAGANDGFPAGLEPVGRLAVHDSAAGRTKVHLSGVFHDKTAVSLQPGDVAVRVDGAVVDGQLDCLASGQTVDVVFLIDITGSMGSVIGSVRDSVVDFVGAIEASGLKGTISVVTFQDTVGVDVTFQQPAPDEGVERSPFFRPVSIADAGGVESLRRFVNRLEANQGEDLPENLAGALDFARNNVIGAVDGAPNVIDGAADPPGTARFPALQSQRQVFVALTDATFHSDDRDANNSSLVARFVPRDAGEILASLQRTGTVVHVIDPSWVDAGLDPAHDDPESDSDWWAIRTGGLGEDVALGYSLVDLELVAVAESAGLFDVALDGILASSCEYSFDGALSAASEVALTLNADGEVFEGVLPVTFL